MVSLPLYFFKTAGFVIFNMLPKIVRPYLLMEIAESLRKKGTFQISIGIPFAIKSVKRVKKC